MNLTFDQAFARLIDAEGGYVCDPRDPGGETKFGICKRSYPALDIKKIDIGMAKAIYRKDFWEPLGDDCHPAIRYQAFDFAVNSGISTALRKLQQAIHVADNCIHDCGFSDEDEDDGFGCCYPGECCMPGLHMRSECHTAADVEAQYEETPN